MKVSEGYYFWEAVKIIIPSAVLAYIGVRFTLLLDKKEKRQK